MPVSRKTRKRRHAATKNPLPEPARAGKALIFLGTETWHARCGLSPARPATGAPRFCNPGKESEMKLNRAARAILSITALAWSIPFAQADDSRDPGVAGTQPGSAELVALDNRRADDRDGDGAMKGAFTLRR
jgi:hypothetical protein